MAAKVLSVATSRSFNTIMVVSMLVSPIFAAGSNFIFGLEHVPKKLIDFFDQNIFIVSAMPEASRSSSTSRPAKRRTRFSEKKL